ncbi:class I SAM-dependent methyltransferase [Hymenobacter sp. BT18]|uniref:class I SAM-dependent methyltransferase n=1 Tax=Hymenobacter sp. BT18 TaxID=2835648 RepID=UPI00143E7B5B|nr:class I SAM-dependent methyltransferase [Hymenobacter sp. BT18]QIX60688.1 class I SAM-dependent methyltransferase [Hymenobacter sp. BT18]
MQRTSFPISVSPVFCALAFSFLFSCTQPVLETRTTASRAGLPDSLGYELRPAQDPNGIGKYFQGRQIAHVMGHDGAGWLERTDRDKEEGTDILLRELRLKSTDVVADLGAGTGYFTFRISPLVPRGKVLAVDIQPEMVAVLKETKARRKATNVQPILGTVQNPNLPANSVDLVLIVDAYHEFDHPREIMQAVQAALRPGGRIALVEYRAEDPNVAIKRIHKMSVAQARRELEAIGLEYVENIQSLPQQHLLIFRKK